MPLLDLRIPPPLVALACAGLAWVLTHYTPGLVFQVPARVWIAAAFVVIGIALDVSGLLVFRKARTTINPLAPGKSTAIVDSGPYAFTRNPMYLGMASVLLGFCVFLANPVSLLAVIAFCAYITRFQIIPEERLLLGKFGEAYARYRDAVRRWV
ncbi:methyltransferase family protein [Arenimonas aestuarii]